MDRVKWIKRKRFLKLLLIMVLISYPFAELTRLIIVNGWPKFPELRTVFVLELIFIWTCFSLIPYLYYCKVK